MRIDGWTHVPPPIRTVTIRGTASELADLEAELCSWTPTGGWSERVQALFSILTEVGEDANGWGDEDV
jgi:hypothetical protein